jgi:hypothetical protein
VTVDVTVASGVADEPHEAAAVLDAPTRVVREHGQ